RPVTRIAQPIVEAVRLNHLRYPSGIHTSSPGAVASSGHADNDLNTTFLCVPVGLHVIRQELVHQVLHPNEPRRYGLVDQRRVRTACAVRTSASNMVLSVIGWSQGKLNSASLVPPAEGVAVQERARVDQAALGLQQLDDVLVGVLDAG